MKKSVVEKLSVDQLKAAVERLALIEKVEASYDKTLAEIKAVCSKNGWETFEQFIDTYDTKMKTSGPKKEKGSRKRLTDDVKVKIVEELKNGATAISLAEKYGVSQPTINTIKKSAGLTKSKAKTE